MTFVLHPLWPKGWRDDNGIVINKDDLFDADAHRRCQQDIFPCDRGMVVIQRVSEGETTP